MRVDAPQRYSDTYDCTASWRAHDGILLSSLVSRVYTGHKSDGHAEHEYQLITGGNDGSIKVWSICPPKASYHRGPKSPLEVYPANPAANNGACPAQSHLLPLNSFGLCES